MLLVAMPGAPNSFLLLVVRMLLVAMPGAPNSLVRMLLVAMPGAPNGFLLLVVRMLLVAMPGAPSSVLAPSSSRTPATVPAVKLGPRTRRVPFLLGWSFAVKRQAEAAS